ncbi:MAG: DNA repair protein RadC [Rikenellaceae bacterium]
MYQDNIYNVSDKLLIRGAESLTDLELLTLMLDDMANSKDLAQSLLDGFGGSLGNLASTPLSRLRMMDGLGLKRAQRIVSAIELGRRCVVELSLDQAVITSSVDVVTMFRPTLENLPHEECWVLYLNASNRVVEQQRVSQGGITATVVDHRLIVKRALELLATNIVLVHNHPSGTAEPSAEDITLTKRIQEAAALFDIKLIDHIIIAANSDISLFCAGLI